MELLLTLFFWTADHTDNPKRTILRTYVLKRWNVHHGSQDLGLMTAKEIRDALRKGTLDPFDKVSAKGSNIREDLIEVDEIFQESEAEDSEASQSEAILPTADGQVPVPLQVQTPVAQSSQSFPIQKSGSQPAARQTPPPIEESDDGPRTNPPPIASPSWRTTDSALAGDKESKSVQKRYYLIDKTKVLGPLSALEIQSLFNRGGLKSKVKVQRIGGTKAIPIAQFIASFSEDRIKELTEDGKLNQKVSSPSSKVLNELARAASAQKMAKDRKNKTYLILGLAGFILGALLLIVFDSSQSPKRSNTESSEPEGRKSRPKLQRVDEHDTGKLKEKDSVETEEREPLRPKTKPVLAVPQPKPTRPQPEPREIRRPNRPVAKVQAAPVAKPAPVVAEKRQASPAPKPVTIVRPRVTESISARKEGPIERALSSGGGVQTVGPLNFSITALEACPSKCTLTLRDSTGTSIKAIFFKSAYYDQLKKSGGTVSLSGSVRRDGGGVTILIQDVR